MKIAIAQLNPVVGDIEQNIAKITSALERTKKQLPDLLVCPELSLTGYPPRDLLERPWFIVATQKGLRKLEKLSELYPETALICGVPLTTEKDCGRGLYNTAVLIYRGKIHFSQHKSLLPAYDVFDEVRYFDPAPEVNVFPFKGEKLGIAICEDSWNDSALWPQRNYSFDPMEMLAREGASLFINISASPFHRGKEKIRFNVICNHAKKHGLPFIFVNQVGGNDELIFDGRSFAVDPDGKVFAAAPSFKESVIMIDLASKKRIDYTFQDGIESVHDALVLGIQDYLRKCGLSKVVIGLSGGIDSAVTCALALKALGPKNVLGVTMPGPYSSKGSVSDSVQLAKNLGIECKIISIQEGYDAYIKMLKPHFEDMKEDLTEENIQARIRGNILMALSNKYGCLVLSTGNKSELAVGYCTLYGDMSGGLSVIADAPKTMVYEIAEYINQRGIIIPRNIITKAPSAELRPNQKDQDSLPPYDVLDAILALYIDQHYSLEEIIREGFDPQTVSWVIKEVNRNEYKRRQAAPGLKVTTKAFGAGRRMPIAAKISG